MSGGGGGKLIALAAAAGACLALVVHEPSAGSEVAPAPTAAAPISTSAPLAAVEAATATAARATAPEAPQPAAPTVEPSQVATATSGVPHVPAPPEVADLAELKTAEIRCYQRDADACFRAAAAYAAGKLLAADEKRAENYRKIELTQLFRQCEKAAVRPCLILAERYANGDGLPVDVKKSRTLVKHVTEVCQRRPAPECELLRAAAH